jgi:hypothetical protein
MPPSGPRRSQDCPHKRVDAVSIIRIKMVFRKAILSIRA